jgi:hypothetical protein
MFTGRLQEETGRLGMRTVRVDVTTTEDDLLGQVSRAFGL